jgi:hypothetical protein
MMDENVTMNWTVYSLKLMKIEECLNNPNLCIVTTMSKGRKKNFQILPQYPNAKND